RGVHVGLHVRATGELRLARCGHARPHVEHAAVDPEALEAATVDRRHVGAAAGATGPDDVRVIPNAQVAAVATEHDAVEVDTRGPLDEELDGFTGATTASGAAACASAGLAAGTAFATCAALAAG